MYGSVENACNVLVLVFSMMLKISNQESRISLLCIVLCKFTCYCQIGQFTDDRYRTKLCTLLAQVSPVEVRTCTVAHTHLYTYEYTCTHSYIVCVGLQVLLERGRVSPMSSSVLGQCASVVSRELLRPGDEFWSAKKTLINLNDAYYFKPPVAAAASAASARAEWPPILKRMLSSSTLRRLQPTHVKHPISAAICTPDILYIHVQYIEEYSSILFRVIVFVPLF